MLDPGSRSLHKGRVIRPADGAVPGGGEAAPPQDDLHELLRAERAPGDPLPEVREQGAPPEGERGAEGVGDPGTTPVDDSRGWPSGDRGARFTNLVRRLM